VLARLCGWTRESRLLTVFVAMIAILVHISEGVLGLGFWCDLSGSLGWDNEIRKRWTGQSKAWHWRYG